MKFQKKTHTHTHITPESKICHQRKKYTISMQIVDDKNIGFSELPHQKKKMKSIVLAHYINELMW